ncbi:MAG: 2-polyprenyl-3-methyl-5-hydroxy-6-metoxy-1,4-benzoquinol methylase [Flavobacteriales bacterium]|jgi:2-polyprenyl-3-methyl-5-hydroxy-6-metoxy-1,4-benzoquinol methylase
MKLKFTHRSSLPELMDDPSLPKDQLNTALKDITKVNRFLGGNQITISGIRKLMESQPEKKEWRIVDVGCGDGEMLRHIARTFKQHQQTFHLKGVDINRESIQMAQELSVVYVNLNFEVMDILKITPEALPCDIVLCNLTMHHFSDPEIHVFLEKFYKLATVGVVINDLHRSVIAYQLFRVFSRIFMKSPIARHDGRISIARGFILEELKQFSKHLGFENDTIGWKWAFRYLWVIKKI